MEASSGNAFLNKDENVIVCDFNVHIFSANHFKKSIQKILKKARIFRHKNF